MAIHKPIISSCLWYDTQAQDAAKFYTSIFQNSEIGKTKRYGKAGKDIHNKEEGDVMTVEFKLENYQFVGLNGGPQFKFNPSISFFINRKTKKEIDELWKELTKEGSVLMPLDSYDFSDRYGWVQDKYGLSWQLILTGEEEDWRPSIMPSFLFTGDKFGKAEEAINFYQSIFKNSQLGTIARNDSDQATNKKDSLLYADFKLEDQWFAAMDSGIKHNFQFNEAISFIVNCASQEEIDFYWDNLSQDGDVSAQQCGWLKDKFGISWQVVPTILPELLSKDSEKSERVMKAFLKMKKLDIKTLEEA